MFGAVIFEDSIHAGNGLNVVGKLKSGLGRCRIRHLVGSRSADSAFTKKPLTQRFIERSKANKMEGKFESRFECGERKK